MHLSTGHLGQLSTQHSALSEPASPHHRDDPPGHRPPERSTEPGCNLAHLFRFDEPLHSVGGKENLLPNLCLGDAVHPGLIDYRGLHERCLHMGGADRTGSDAARSGAASRAAILVSPIAHAWLSRGPTVRRCHKTMGEGDVGHVTPPCRTSRETVSG